MRTMNTSKSIGSSIRLQFVESCGYEGLPVRIEHGSNTSSAGVLGEGEADLRQARNRQSKELRVVPDGQTEGQSVHVSMLPQRDPVE